MAAVATPYDDYVATPCHHSLHYLALLSLHHFRFFATMLICRLRLFEGADMLSRIFFSRYFRHNIFDTRYDGYRVMRAAAFRLFLFDEHAYGAICPDTLLYVMLLQISDELFS